MIIHRWTQIGGPARTIETVLPVTGPPEASLSREARLIRTAQADDYYDPAVRAHRSIQDIEKGLSKR